MCHIQEVEEKIRINLKLVGLMGEMVQNRGSVGNSKIVNTSTIPFIYVVYLYSYDLPSSWKLSK